LFLPSVIKQLNSTISSRDGKEFSRLVSSVYNLEDTQSAAEFYSSQSKEVSVPFSDKKIHYVPEKRLAVGLSRLGTSKATALGAYAIALSGPLCSISVKIIAGRFIISFSGIGFREKDSRYAYITAEAFE
jgi:hypothetical protein